MSFPSFSKKPSSASFLSNSIQNSHTRSMKSLHSTLSSRISSSTQMLMNKVNDSSINNLSKIPTSTDKENNPEFIQTPTILAKHIRNINPPNKYSNANASAATAESTLVQMSTLSMGNIDTPIT